MKLNHDCVRDLLLYLEENLTCENKIAIHNLQLKHYTKPELIYTADKLTEANFIKCIRKDCYDDNAVTLFAKSITYEGHQLLDTIRDDGVWKETKKIANKVATVPIKMLSEIGTKVITDIISKQMGISI